MYWINGRRKIPYRGIENGILGRGDVLDPRALPLVSHNETANDDVAGMTSTQVHGMRRDVSVGRGSCAFAAARSPLTPFTPRAGPLG